MKNIIVPVITHSHHHNSGSLSLLGGLITLFATIYIFYFFIVCMERNLNYINRKQFIIYLLIPFLMWIIWFIELFKKDNNE